MPTPHRGRPAGSRKAPRSRGRMPNLEVITMGRVGVDLYPEQIGVTLMEVRTFAKSLGGSPTNVAVAAARLGRRAAVITKVGDDGFGVYVRRATVVLGNIEEVDMATGTRDPVAGAAALLDLGARIAIVKRGGEGVYARTASEEVTVPPVEIPVLNGLGAGDAFGGALCHGLLAGWPLRRTLEAANAAGAIVASRLACADAMPTLAEIETVLARKVSA